MSDPKNRSYRVLCVGGPLDGRWRTVHGRSFEAIEKPEGFSLADMANPDDVAFRRRVYDVEALGLFRHTLHVAFCAGQFEGSYERERAAMRAVLRRDVVNHLEGDS